MRRAALLPALALLAAVGGRASAEGDAPEPAQNGIFFREPDKETGAQYLVVTGAGCTELRRQTSGKTTKTVEE